MRRLATRSAIWKRVLYVNNYEPRHDKTNKVTVHPVWSVFAVCMKKAWVLSYPLSTHQRLWSDRADAQADLSLRWAHSHFVVLSCHGSIMFNPTLLFHKTTAVCSFYTPSTFLHTWLIRSPLTIVPRGVSLQVLRYGKLCWLSACVSMFCGFTFYQIYSLLLRRLPCTLLMLTWPFVLTARELSRYTCTCSMPFILWTWLCLASYSYVLQTAWCQVGRDVRYSSFLGNILAVWSMSLALPRHRHNYFQFLFMIQNGKWFSYAECICVVCVEV